MDNKDCNKDCNNNFFIGNNLFLTVLAWGIVPFIMVAILTKKRTNSLFKSILAGICVFLILIMIYGNTPKEEQLTHLNNITSETETPEPTEKSTPEATLSPEEQKIEIDSPTEEPTPEAKKNKEYTFISGNYICGKDFEPGTYNIIAVEGSSGNVISSGSFLDGGVNEVMGINGEWSIKQVNNIQFKKDQKLEIRGITIKLVISD